MVISMGDKPPQHKEDRVNTQAFQLAMKIVSNADDWFYDRITRPTWEEKNATLWQQVDNLKINDEVDRELHKLGRPRINIR
jgi:hypothetical protein